MTSNSDSEFEVIRSASCDDSDLSIKANVSISQTKISADLVQPKRF